MIRAKKINQRNDRLSSRDPKYVSTFMRTKFTVTVMVLEDVSIDVNIMPSHFLPRGLRVNVVDYKEVPNLIVML